MSQRDTVVTFVSDADIETHVTLQDIVPAIEQAFIDLEAGNSEAFDVVRGRGGGDDHFFAIKSGRVGSIPALGLKAGSYAPGNHALGLPAHTSTTMLIDDLTGRPFAVVEANYLNGIRTAATNALATRCLAKPAAKTLGVFGIGAQAIFETCAVASVRPIERVIACARSTNQQGAFAAAIRERLNINVEFADARTTCENADVLVTVTPSQAPLFSREWVRPGTHISAMGADNVGKQELEVELVAQAQLWVDLPSQAVAIGETQHAFRAGHVTLAQLQHQTLGRLLTRPELQKHSPDQITVFDSSGLAIQDLAAAYAALQVVTKHKR